MLAIVAPFEQLPAVLIRPDNLPVNEPRNSVPGYSQEYAQDIHRFGGFSEN